MDILAVQNIADTLGIANDILEKVVEINNNTQPDYFIGMHLKDLNKVEYLNLVFAFLAFIASIIAVVIDFKGFRASKRTADNVMRVTEDVQIAQFSDLLRHFYRNQVVSISLAREVLNVSTRVKFPSESHFQKLKVLSDDYLHLEKFNSDSMSYSKMHELKLLCRNYDVEIDVAQDHVRQKHLIPEDLEGDMDNLLFKPMYLAKRICDIENHVFESYYSRTNRSPYDQAAIIFISEHLNKLSENKSSLASLSVSIIDESSGYPWIKFIKALDMFLKGKTDAIGEWRLNWADVLAKSNAFLNPHARSFANDLVEVVKKTNLETLADGSYYSYLQSVSFPVKEMLFLTICVDAAIEEGKIKTLTF